MIESDLKENKGFWQTISLPLVKSTKDEAGGQIHKYYGIVHPFNPGILNI